MPSFIFIDHFLIALFGLAIGSFASYVTYRLGEGQDLLFSYSKCTSCNYRLKCYNLIPLFSWFLQKGKCSNCGVKISIRYPLLELMFLVIFLVIFSINNFQINESLVFLLTFASIFLMIAIIDIEYYFVPIQIQIVLLLTVLIFHLFNVDNFDRIFYFCYSAVIFSAFSYFLYYVFLIFLKKEAIGVDDIKLFFTIGLLLGLKKFVDFAFLCGLFGLIFGIIWQKAKDDETFPFAPAILTSTFICFIMRENNSFLELIIIKAANILA